MKMKSLLTLVALTAVGATMAEVTTANTLCRIEINSGTKSTIVGVPLAAVGATDNANIPVSSLVLTDNLSENDTLLRWNGKTWDAWRVNAAGAWEPTVIAEGSNMSQTAPAADTALARGEAIWVNRNDASNPFYIYGQLATREDAQMPAITRDSSAPTYIMMGNTKLADVAISALALNGTPVEGDKIAVAVTTGLGVKEYTYNGVNWTKAVLALGDDGILNATVKIVDEKDKIPAGQGFWYIAVAQ